MTRSTQFLATRTIQALDRFEAITPSPVPASQHVALQVPEPRYSPDQTKARRQFVSLVVIGLGVTLGFFTVFPVLVLLVQDLA